MKSKTYTQTKQPLDKTQSSKLCQLGVGGKKAVKTRDVVNVAMEKAILKLHEVVVPIGSGLLSTFSHFYIITLFWQIK